MGDESENRRERGVRGKKGRMEDVQKFRRGVQKERKGKEKRRLAKEKGIRKGKGERERQVKQRKIKGEEGC